MISSSQLSQFRLHQFYISQRDKQLGSCIRVYSPDWAEAALAEFIQLVHVYTIRITLNRSVQSFDKKNISVDSNFRLYFIHKKRRSKIAASSTKSRSRMTQCLSLEFLAVKSTTLKLHPHIIFKIRKDTLQRYRNHGTYSFCVISDVERIIPRAKKAALIPWGNNDVNHFVKVYKSSSTYGPVAWCKEL